MRFLKEWMQSYEFNLRKQMQQHPVHKEIKNRVQALHKTEKEITTINQQIQKTYALLEQEVYTLDVFRKRQQDLKTELSQLNNSREHLLKEIKDLETAEASRSTFLPKIKNLIDTYSDSTIDTKNKMLSEVLYKVTYEKTQRNKKGQLKNANFTFHVYQRVPK